MLRINVPCFKHLSNILEVVYLTELIKLNKNKNKEVQYSMILHVKYLGTSTTVMQHF